MRERPPEPEILPRLLNRQNAARYLSISVAMLDTLARSGEVRVVRLPAARGIGPSRVPLFDRADLDTFIEKIKSGGAR